MGLNGKAGNGEKSVSVYMKACLHTYTYSIKRDLL